MSSPKKRPSSIHLFDLIESLPLLPPGVGVLGEDVEGEPFLVNLLLDEMAHILVTGEREIGKTALLRVLATSLALLSRQAELQLILIDTDLAGGNDPRGTLQPVSYLPHNLTGIIVTIDDAISMLDFLVEETAYRVEQTINRPHIIVFIDHLFPLLVEGGPFVEEALQRLLGQGTEAGVHLVVATRLSEAPALAGLLEAPWPVRVVRTPATGGYVHNGKDPSRGEFLAKVGETDLPFQAALLDDYDLEICLEDLRRYRPPALIARPLPHHPFA